jgi:hypothetical protein
MELGSDCAILFFVQISLRVFSNRAVCASMCSCKFLAVGLQMMWHWRFVAPTFGLDVGAHPC